MNDDNFDDKINNAPTNKEKKENLENSLLKSSAQSKSVDSEKGQKQNNLRNDYNNNAINGDDDELPSGKSANESNNISANINNIGNNLSNNTNPSNQSNSNISNENANIDHSLDIAVLNEINKACQLAMNNISYLANMIKDKEMRKELVAAYSQYSNIILQINQRFESYGEVPDEVSIKLKLIGMSSIRTQTCRDKSNSHISEIMIQGTIMGIIKCTKILNAKLEIDQETTDLLTDFNNFQKQNIEKFYKFL